MKVGGLDPSVVEERVSVYRGDKGVRVTQLPEPFSGEVIAYIGEAQAAGDAGGTRHGGKEIALVRIS